MQLIKFIAVIIICAAPAASTLHAADLININTADSASLQTLNGIGPSKAQAIIDYRVQYGPFAKIEDIMNVSGIGTATYNNIKDFITVGAAPVPAPQATSSEPQTQSPSQQNARGNEPPPITVRVNADTLVTAGGGSFFEAAAYGTQGLPLPGTRFIWNFGDGTTAEGARVFHSYAYPGKYAVSVTAAYNYSSTMERVEVVAVAAQVSLRAEGDGSLLIRNLSNNDLDVGLWSLVDGARYVIPEHTLILPGEGVRFAPSVTGLPGTAATTLRYPNDMLAAPATVGPGSPLRGERVPAVPPQPVAVRAAAAPPAGQGEVLGASTGAGGAPQQQSSDMLVPALAALAGVLVAGAAGAHYAGRYKTSGTSTAAEGFDIEEDQID